MKYISAVIKGRVQGVFYRASTQKVARDLSLIGFVTNRPDGSVYLEAAGDQNDLDQLISWCQKGPNLAQVNQVKVTSIPAFTREDLNPQDFLII